MNNLNVSQLLSALENETNASIMGLTTPKLKEIKNNMLQSLQLDRNKLKLFHKKLKDYRYCSDMNDLQYGYYIRWVSLKNPDIIKLTTGGIIIDIDIIKNCVQIRVKNKLNRILLNYWGMIVLPTYFNITTYNFKCFFWTPTWIYFFTI